MLPSHLVSSQGLHVGPTLVGAFDVGEFLPNHYIVNTVMFGLRADAELA